MVSSMSKKVGQATKPGIAGPMNLSKWGTSDIPEELYHVHARKRIWDDWTGKLERPIPYKYRSVASPALENSTHAGSDPSTGSGAQGASPNNVNCNGVQQFINHDI